MADTPNPNDPNAPDAAAAATAPDADKKVRGKKAELIKLQHEVKGNWTLRIDASEYAVVDGVVEVPPWHYDAAHQAGFR